MALFERCCDVGRAWSTQSSSVCGPYPGDIDDHPQTGVVDAGDVTACSAVLEVCCVLEGRAAQCRRGRQVALTTFSCRQLHHSAHLNDDAKVFTTAHYLARSSTIVIIGPILWGHSGPLCHALSLLLSSLSWTSMCRRRATVAACDSSDTW